VVLLRCPRCRGFTPTTDATDVVECQWCRLRVGTVERHLVRDPQAARRVVLDDLSPIAALLRTFGIGQIIIAVVHFAFFIGCNSLLEHFHGSVNQVLVIASGLVLFAGGVFIFAGSEAVRRGRGRLFAVVGSLFALTSPLLIGVPVGVWALWRLSRPEVRAAFADRPPSQ
jgi:uncharacterized protein YjeT (DUF2065 family)